MWILKIALIIPLLVGGVYFLGKGFVSIFIRLHQDVLNDSKLTSRYFLIATGLFSIALFVFEPTAYLEAIFLFVSMFLLTKLRLLIQKKTTQHK